MKKIKVLLMLIILIFLPIYFFGCNNNNNTKENSPKYYLGETMQYDDISVTVNDVSETKSSNTYIILVKFILKNNTTEEQSFDDDCFDIRTEDKGEKYNTQQVLFYQKVIAGASEEIWLEFRTPYSLIEKNYIMYFDWGLLHKEKSYCLYKREFTQAVLEYELSADTLYYIVKGIGGCKEKSEIEIPSTYNGLPVKVISSKAFYENKKITSVTIGNNVEEILSSAFYQCSNLESIALNEGLKYIRTNAFGNCEKLTELNIPGTVEAITGDQFMPNLKKVKISNLENWCKIEFTQESSNPLKYGKYLYINNQLIENFEIPNTVTKISNYAFANCQNMKYVIVPDSVVSMGYGIFGNCTNLENITLPFIGQDINPDYGTEFRYIFGRDGNSVPESLKSVTITKGTILKSGSFSGCQYLKNITIPESIEIIEENAFSGCSSLKSINIPNSIKEISVYSFKDCSNLQYNRLDGVKYLGNSSNLYLVACGLIDKSANEININSNCTTIANYAFANSTYITEIEIFENIKNLGSHAFSGCSQLATVKLPTSIKQLKNSLFLNCTSLKTINLTENLTNIEGYAFKGCSSLETIKIPSTIKKISTFSFYGCSSLKSIELHDDITNIEGYAFNGCTALTSLCLPENLMELGEYSFENCTSLAVITIYTKLTNFNAGIFMGCTSLNTINYEGSTTDWQNINKIIGYQSQIGYVGWDHETGRYVVHCNNGNLNKGQ